MVEKLKKFKGFKLPKSEMAVLKDLMGNSDLKKKKKKKELRGLRDYWEFNIVSDKSKILDLMFHIDGYLIIRKNHIIGLFITESEIPTSISLLKRLEALVIENANLNTLPKELTQLKKLRRLDIIESNLESIPNLAATFPKLERLVLKGVKLKSTPAWLLDFARKHYSYHYMSELPNFGNIKDPGWYDEFIFNVGVNKEDAAVLGLLEILLGGSLDNDQVIDHIYGSFDTINQSLDEIYDEIRSKVVPTLKSEQGELSIITCTAPWDYNRMIDVPRFTLNKEGYVIGLDVAMLLCEGGELLLPYFPKEIGNLQHLQVLRIGFQYPQIYPSPDSEYHLSDLNEDPKARIPNSIRKLKDLRYFWTNAKYSEALKPFLNSLEEFGYLN